MAPSTRHTTSANKLPVPCMELTCTAQPLPAQADLQHVQAPLRHLLSQPNTSLQDLASLPGKAADASLAELKAGSAGANSGTCPHSFSSHLAKFSLSPSLAMSSDLVYFQVGWHPSQCSVDKVVRRNGKLRRQASGMVQTMHC